MSEWTSVLDVDFVNKLAVTLNESTSNIRQVRQNALDVLESVKQHPQLVKSLTYLLVYHVDGIPATVRAAAGLLLKNNILTTWPHIDEPSLQFVKAEILRGLTDSDSLVRNISSIVVTTLFTKLTIANWTELVGRLLQLIETGDANAQDGALQALAKVCEDSADDLDKDVTGNNDRPSNLLIPRFIQFTQSDKPKVRSRAVFCLVQFVPHQSQAFLAHIDDFLAAIFTLAKNNPDADCCTNIAMAFNALLKARPDKLAIHMEGVVNFCLFCTKSEDEHVALEGAEFILNVAENEQVNALQIVQLLPTIVPCLIANLVYSEMDQFLLENMAEDDEAEEDRSEDIKPNNFKTKDSHHLQSKGGEDDDDDDDDENALEDWNLRKCSAAALDMFATRFATQILELLLPDLQTRIVSPKWPIRESAVLAFGAIAEGCISAQELSFVPQLVNILVGYLNDEHPQVREISCWTLSRYSEQICCEPTIFKPVFEGLLQCSLDRNKKVQEGGCSAVSVMAENAGEMLEPWAGPLFEHLEKCFKKYKQKNMPVLYDAIQSVVAACSNAVADPGKLSILMGPLFERWKARADDDQELLPLIECLAAVSAHAGEAFAPYTVALYERSLQLIQQALVLDNEYKQDPLNNPMPDKAVIVCALDLIDGIVQGLRLECLPLFERYSNPSLLDILDYCLNDSSRDVQQSAFALVGDMAINTYAALQPRLSTYVPLAIERMDSSDPYMHPVCNNAIWAIGEISIHAGRALEPFFDALLPRLLAVERSHAIHSVLENASCTIGRLGMSFSKEVAPYLADFLDRWLFILSDTAETTEKETAFIGICRCICANPSAVDEPARMLALIESFGSYMKPPPELRAEFLEVLQTLKLKSSSFDGACERLSPEMMQQLQINCRV